MKPSITCENCEALTAELEQLRRIDRADAGIARQLSRSMESRAKMEVSFTQARREIEQLAAAYPDDANLKRCVEIMKRF